MRTLARRLALASLVSSPALGWGVDGHLIVCEIALQRVSPAGKALITEVQSYQAEILDPFRRCESCQAAHPDDGRALTFQEGCVWPDEARRDTFRDTYDYHFVDVPRAKPFDFARDCRRLDCALVGIQRYARTLAEPAAGSRAKEQKALALRFLGHFVGDLHQPLHVGNVEDLGGNTIRIQWFGKQETLHGVWDSGILARAKLTPGLAVALNRQISAAEQKRWSSFDLQSWARESNASARAFAYAQASGTRVKNGDALGQAYFARAEPVATEQLKKAGVRLALLIDAAASGKLPQNLLEAAE